ncbi:hypothetical protein Q8A67_025073 [Cirrhinus molitorella]|uniref:Uncharacterized protein n=1 Tax=Cirrhinus molitorella TaxID=172907 RepID=A0AA88NTX3_9TELE|nr:hypothetical protein Q8A67_025073 [Cirrhinus molitorella]
MAKPLKIFDKGLEEEATPEVTSRALSLSPSLFGLFSLLVCSPDIVMKSPRAVASPPRFSERPKARRTTAEEDHQRPHDALRIFYIRCNMLK